MKRYIEVDDSEIREKQIERMVRAFGSSLRPFSHLVTVCSEATDAELQAVRHLMGDWIDKRLVLGNRGNSDADELEFILKGLDKLFRVTGDVVSERRLSIAKNKGKAIDLDQPKYSMQTVADLLHVTKATVGNWSHQRGGYLRAFEFKGVNKFVLEEDLLRKYEEVFSRSLLIDHTFRQEHEYRPNPKKLKEAMEVGR